MLKPSQDDSKSNKKQHPKSIKNDPGTPLGAPGGHPKKRVCSRPRILQVFIDFGTPLDLHFSTLFDAFDPQRPLRPLPGRVLRSGGFFVCFGTSPGRPPSGFGSVNAISNSISTDSIFGHIWITFGVVFGAFGPHGTTFCDHFAILGCFFRRLYFDPIL